MKDLSLAKKKAKNVIFLQERESQKCCNQGIKKIFKVDFQLFR
jgi:hypothetical protein